MTNAEITELVGYINQRWPHAPLEAHVIPVWIEDLADLPREECAGAVRRWAKNGEKFPPTSGWVFSEVERRSQLPAPPFEQVGAAMMRTTVYSPVGQFTPEDTAQAVQEMAERGVHEAILRFVQERGFRAVLMIPWGEVNPLDRNQSADRRDSARAYDQTVQGWRADPTPGLALARARAAIGDGRRGDLRAIDPSRHLEDGQSA